MTDDWPPALLHRYAYLANKSLTSVGLDSTLLMAVCLSVMTEHGRRCTIEKLASGGHAFGWSSEPLGIALHLDKRPCTTRLEEQSRSAFTLTAQNWTIKFTFLIRSRFDHDVLVLGPNGAYGAVLHTVLTGDLNRLRADLSLLKMMGLADAD